MAKAYYWNDKIWNNTNAGSGGWGMAIYNYRASSTAITTTTGATLFPATFAAADAIYFGTLQFYGKTFRNIYFDIGTAMAGTYTLAWEYHNGNTWTALTVTDNTANFTNLGANSVDFTPPTDWQAINPTPAVGAGYWVRCRVATCTVSTTNPVMTGGQYIKFGNNTFAITGDTAGTDDITFNDIYNNAGAAPITRLSTDTIGRRAYRLDCHLSYSRMAVNGGTADNKAGFLNDNNCDIHFGNECRFFSFSTTSQLTLGKSLVTSVAGYQGCTIRYNRTSYGATNTIRIDDDANGTVKLYDTKFIQLQNGIVPPTNFVTQSLFVSNGTNTSSIYLDVVIENMNFVDLQGGAGVSKKRISLYNISQAQLGGGGTIDDVKSVQGGCQFGLFLQSAVNLTISNLRASNHISKAINTYGFGNTCYLVNPSYTRPVGTSTNGINWGWADYGKVLEQYTVNVHVQDEAGNAIPSATVAMKPDATAPVQTLENSNNFSVATDASGNIAQQTLTSAMFQALNSTLSSSMANGDATINVTDTTNFHSSGFPRYVVFDNGEIRSYTGKTATTLTGSAHYSGAATGQSNGAKIYCCVQTNSTISDYGPFVITVSKSGFKTMRLRKLSVLTATYGLKGVTLTVVMPRENINLASDVITVS